MAVRRTSRRSLARTTGVLVLLALVATCLTACGDSSTPKTSAAETPVAGGILREGLVHPSSEDPARAQSVSERVLTDALYDGLTRWEPMSLSAQPALASGWNVSADQRVWTFKIRPDAKAANGEAVTATDVKTSLQRVAKRSANSGVTDYLAPISGFATFTADDAAPDLAGIVVTDEHTVTITLDKPYAEFDLLLGNPAFGIVHSSPSGPSTTGPFFVAARADGGITLRKAPGANAYLDGIDVFYYPDAATSYLAFTKGEIDWSPVAPANSQQAGDAYGRNLFQTSLRTVSLSFNLASPGLNDLRVRQAIMHAINRRAVVDKLKPTLGGEILNGIVVDGVPGSQGGGCGEACNYDAEAAKKLLAEVYPGAPVPPISLDVSEPIAADAVTQIVSDLAVVGIVATVRPTQLDQYGNVTVAGDRQLFQTSWAAAYPSADAFLPPQFDSGSSANVTGLVDGAIDQALVAAQSQPDVVQRRLQYQNLEGAIMAKLPVVPLAQLPVASVATKTVRGVAPLPTGNFDPSTVWMTTVSSAPVSAPAAPIAPAA